MKLDDQVHLLGVRHHGPGCASSLKQALAEIEPDLILLEGAQELEESWRLCGSDGMCPPVAQLVYDPKTPAQAVFYPWGEFSPEWQAMRYALQVGCELRMMDLPVGIEFELQAQEQAEDLAREAEKGALDGDQTEPDAKPASASPFDLLARAAGHDDGERWWDMLVEHHRCGLDLFDAVAEAMTEVRRVSEAGSGDDPDRPGSRDRLREAWMRQVLRASRKEFKRIAVICGAWHVPALAASVKVKDDHALLKGLKRRKVEVAWVPYTYARFALDSGYRAGIRSPGWYEHLFRHHESGSDADTQLIEWMTRIAHCLRREGFDCSSAEVIEGVRLARNLSVLRGLATPGLDDTLDAARAVMTRGNGGPLAIIHDRLVIADRLGTLPETIPRLPLEQDLDSQLKRLRLGREEVQQIKLDLRKDIGLARSILLHRLALLGIDWGTRLNSTGLGTFWEAWRLAWKPELAIHMIDASTLGNTVESAAGKRLAENIEREDTVSGIAAILDIVQLTDLTNALPTAVVRLKTLAAVSADLQDLMNALLSLVQVSRYGSVRATSGDALAQIIDGIVIRVTNGLAPSCVQLDEDAAYAMIGCIDKTHAAINLLESDTYLARWKRALGEVLDNGACHPVVLGRCTRMLYDLDVLDSAALDHAFRLAVSRGNAVVAAAAWVEGLLLDGAVLLLHDDTLFRVIDGWIGELEDGEFLVALPLVRRAFSTFSAQALSQIGDRVLYGSLEAPSAATEIDPALVRGALPQLKRMLGLG